MRVNSSSGLCARQMSSSPSMSMKSAGRAKAYALLAKWRRSLNPSQSRTLKNNLLFQTYNKTGRSRGEEAITACGPFFKWEEFVSVVLHCIFGEKQAGASYRTRPGAYLIAVSGAQIASIRTPKGFFLPGGGVEPGETHEPVFCVNVWRKQAFWFR